MKNNNQLNTLEQKKAYLDACMEGRVTATEILQEIQPLLSEYFQGGNQMEGNALWISLPNGQKFKLEVSAMESE